MKHTDDRWEEVLGDIFGAWINQQRFEEGVEQMSELAVVDPRFHRECLSALDSGIAAAQRHDGSVLGHVNRSGYRVRTIDEALKLMTDVKVAYLAAFHRSESDRDS